MDDKTGTNKYDDSDKGGFSYSEKLALVAGDMMAPEEIGVASAKEAQDIMTKSEGPPPVKFGDFLGVDMSVVPLELRAHWARQDLKVMPSGVTAQQWEEKWIEEHKGKEFAVQCKFQSGTIAGILGQLYTDPVLGFVEMLRKISDLVEERYTQLKQTDPNPIIYRNEKKDSSNKPSAGPEQTV